MSITVKRFTNGLVAMFTDDEIIYVPEDFCLVDSYKVKSGTYIGQLQKRVLYNLYAADNGSHLYAVPAIAGEPFYTNIEDIKLEPNEWFSIDLGGYTTTYHGLNEVDVEELNAKTVRL